MALDDLERARRWAPASGIGIALRAVALTDDGSDSVARLREAVDALERSPARLEHARALTDLGAALRRANLRAEARTRSRRRSTSPVAATRVRWPTVPARSCAPPGEVERAGGERDRRLDRVRAPCRRAGGRGTEQSRDRAGAIRDPQDRGDPSRPRLPQARHRGSGKLAGALAGRTRPATADLPEAFRHQVQGARSVISPTHRAATRPYGRRHGRPRPQRRGRRGRRAARRASRSAPGHRTAPHRPRRGRAVRGLARLCRRPEEGARGIHGTSADTDTRSSNDRQHERHEADPGSRRYRQDRPPRRRASHRPGYPDACRLALGGPAVRLGGPGDLGAGAAGRGRGRTSPTSPTWRCPARRRQCGRSPRWPSSRASGGWCCCRAAARRRPSGPSVRCRIPVPT